MLARSGPAPVAGRPSEDGGAPLMALPVRTSPRPSTRTRHRSASGAWTSRSAARGMCRAKPLADTKQQPHHNHHLADTQPEAYETNSAPLRRACRSVPDDQQGVRRRTRRRGRAPNRLRGQRCRRAGRGDRPWWVAMAVLRRQRARACEGSSAECGWARPRRGWACACAWPGRRIRVLYPAVPRAWSWSGTASTCLPSVAPPTGVGQQHPPPR